MYQVIILYDEIFNKSYFESYFETPDENWGNITVEELPPYADPKKAHSCYWDRDNQQWIYDEEKYQSIINGDLAAVKQQKISEMNRAQQEAIQNGVNVVLSNGTIEHFTLKDQDQTSLMGLQSQVALGVEKIPWHPSNHDEHCKYYSNADMALILQAAMQYITFHITYFRDLRIYINSMDNILSINAVNYGVYIPEEYQSEVLADLYAAQNA